MHENWPIVRLFCLIAKNINKKTTLDKMMELSKNPTTPSKAKTASKKEAPKTETKDPKKEQKK